jgi:hypothetical protein
VLAAWTPGKGFRKRSEIDRRLDALLFPSGKMREPSRWAAPRGCPPPRPGCFACGRSGCVGGGVPQRLARTLLLRGLVHAQRSAPAAKRMLGCRLPNAPPSGVLSLRTRAGAPGAVSACKALRPQSSGRAPPPPPAGRT